MAASMTIDVHAAPGPHAAPRIQTYQRWLGVCRVCNATVQRGEYVTWVPQRPVRRMGTHRMAVVHVACVTLPMRSAGRSCTPSEYAWLMALAGPREE